MIFAVFAIIVLLFIIVISILLKRAKITPVLYKNKTVYSDTEKPEKPFFSKEYLLAGKPDSILHTKDGLVPVEVKSSKRPIKPYYSHIMQLMSYCLLLELNREKPNYGYIQYADGEPFVVGYTDSMRNELIKTIYEMRGCIRTKKMPIIEKEFNKCNNCGYKGACY